MKIEIEKPRHFVSPVNWYLASILVRCEWEDGKIDNFNRRCLAWENQILIKASCPEEAYIKAMEKGKSEEGGEIWRNGDENLKGKWHFEGLTSLLAIYDELEDGAEIVWTEYRNRSVKTIQRRVKSKEELEVFGG